MNQEKKKQLLPYLLLIVIIVLQLVWTSYVFLNVKQGYHSDEIWSYGLANSYYKPFIYLNPGVNIDTPTADDYDNIHEWITGETFKNYITVQENERFTYGSVYSNQTYDHHPPLYYFLLHTLCSFFPNQFSFGYAYFLSCLFLIGTQIFLFLLGKEITHSSAKALLPCFFYAGTNGALSTFIFLRQYNLLTMLTVMFIYFCARYLNDLSNKKILIPVFITAFLCFMTHYYGIIFVGAFTACVCLYLLLRRFFKKMFAFGLGMVGTLGIYFAVYPAALSQMLNNQRSSSDAPYSFGVQLRWFISYTTRSLFAYEFPVFSTGNSSIVLAAIILAIVVIIPLCFLFRNETWFQKFQKMLRTKCEKALASLKAANYTPLFSIIASAALLLVVNAIVNTYLMGLYSLRYIFVIFPFLCFAVVLIFMQIVSWIPKCKRFLLPITSLAAAALILTQNLTQTSYFLFSHFEKEKNTDYAELLKDQNCIIIQSEKYACFLQDYAPYLYQADNVYVSGESNENVDNTQRILSKNIPVNYIFTRNLPVLSESQEAQLQDISGTVSDDSADTTDDRMEAFLQATEELQNTTKDSITEIIKAIDPDMDFEIIGKLNILNSYTYLLKVH